MKLDQFLIGLLLVAAFITAGVYFLVDVHVNYSPFGAELDESLFTGINTSAYEMRAGLKEDANLMEDKSLEGDVAEEDSLDTVIRGSFSAVRLVTGSFGLVHALLNNIADVIGVPGYIISTTFAIITILIVFAVIRIFTRAAV